MAEAVSGAMMVYVDDLANLPHDCGGTTDAIELAAGVIQACQTGMGTDMNVASLVSFHKKQLLYKIISISFKLQQIHTRRKVSSIPI